MAKRKPANDQRTRTGPVKGEFIAPPEVADADERADALRAQEEFSKPATRFGSVLEEPDRMNKFDKMKKPNLVNPVNPVHSPIHGYKGAIPVWVGEPDQKKGVTAKDVEDFANAMRKTLRYKQDNLRDGIMLAWAFRPDAAEAAERLRKLEQTELNFIRLDMIRIDSPRFREHVTALSTHHADYENFLTFVHAPRVEVGYKRLKPRTYLFDVSETAVLNPGARIINVQWDFAYGKRFSSTQGYSFVRTEKKEPALQAQCEFPRTGQFRIACKVQDDVGGEGTWTGEIEVS
jgi:hypothetical protein